ncbi:MAG TPA: DUF6468 domain-containing protein [Arenibaculum sp.]|nr:DUF6468 domain-containing protein [Arenibaculum sp.]
MSVLALVLDLAIVGLLVATIAYAINLNRRLVHLRDSKAELDELVRGFAEAAERAEAGVHGMKQMAADAGDRLQKTVDRAQGIRDELQFMVEAADSVATRLEGTIAQPRPAAPAAAAKPPVAGSVAGSAPGPAPGARPGSPATGHARPRAEPQAASPPAEPARRTTDPAPDSLSRAERELMKAIERMR